MASITARQPCTGRIVEFLIDDDDVEFVSKFRWRINANGYPVTTIKETGRRVPVAVSRLLLRPERSCIQVDHKDGNPLNNRRANLRLATGSQNQANKFHFPKNTSGFRGVTWHKQCQKWQAAIKVNRRNHHLGLFDSAESASLAYLSAARQFYGEFSAQNGRVVNGISAP